MADPAATVLVIGPNASLSGRAAALAVAWIALLAFGIAGFFALRGYWPILPFAGLEVGAFAAAIWVALRRNHYREVLSFEGRALRIEFGLAGSGARSSLEMSRAWTRVSVETGPHRNSATRLVLACSGQRIEIGRCLTDEEREALCARIAGLVGSAWRREGPVEGAAGIMAAPES